MAGIQSQVPKGRCQVGCSHLVVGVHPVQGLCHPSPPHPPLPHHSPRVTSEEGQGAGRHLARCQVRGARWPGGQVVRLC